MERSPPEIVLLIVEAGDFGVDEGLAIRATCRKLLSIASERYFWLAIASKTSFLPLPSLHSLAMMSAAEIMKLCIHYKHTRDNIHSKQPEILKQRVLNMPDDGGNVCGWNFLPGGRYITTYHENGFTNLWDTGYREAKQGEPPWQEMKGKAIQVGRRLASYEIGFAINQTQTYKTCGDNDREVRCVATSDEGGASTDICIFRFIFRNPNHVEVEDLLRSTLHVLYPTVASSRDLSVFCGEWQGQLRIAVVDWKRNQRRIIDTGFEYVFGAFDPHLTDGSDLLLTSQGGTQLTIHVYFDISAHLSDHHPSLGSNGCGRFLAPNATRHISYEGSSRTTPLSEFITFTAFNTPNSRTTSDLVVIGLGRDGPDAGDRTFGVQTLDPTKIIQQLKTDSHGNLQTSPRALHHCSRPVVLVDGTELLVIGTCGRHLMWVTTSDPQRFNEAELVVEVVTLLKSGDATTATSISASLRRLDIPLDLKTIEQMDICDEMGVFGFATKVDDAWSIHLFDY
ncbi:hypothetical protein FRB95_004486 [Tulasnella sp. JGI-2019a]|nr:hypothetical protein FRB95_004486 [Tulasnella sp. JGI-2019a]